MVLHGGKGFKVAAPLANTRFAALLARMGAMHDKKAADYAAAGDRYSNFKVAGALALPFTDPIDIAFATLIGVKIARLQELRGKGKAARNESVQDTFLDLAVYAALWASYYEEESAEGAPPATVSRQATPAEWEAAFARAPASPRAASTLVGGLGGGSPRGPSLSESD